MDATKSRLLALVRAALGAEKVDEILFVDLSPTEWNALYRLAAAQGVLALTWDCVQRFSEACLPPREVRIRWAMGVEHIEEHYARQRDVIARLAGFYKTLGIRMMLLKGYGLSLCYPTPEHRPCGDVDIWLFGEQARADEAIRRAWKIPIDEDKHHHTVFSINGIMVENHYDFLNVHAHASNRNLEAILRSEAEREGEAVEIAQPPCNSKNDAQSTGTAHETAAETVTVYLPTANFNALFLLRHAASHFAAREIALRHVIDWMVFIDHYHAQIDWAKLERTAQRMNMHRFLHCMHAAAITLGLNERKIPPFERDAALEQRVLEDILEPEFNEVLPKSNVVNVVWFKSRRWWANRWKHRIVYREGLLQTFIQSVWCHLLKPKSIGHL